MMRRARHLFTSHGASITDADWLRFHAFGDTDADVCMMWSRRRHRATRLAPGRYSGRPWRRSPLKAAAPSRAHRSVTWASQRANPGDEHIDLHQNSEPWLRFPYIRIGAVTEIPLRRRVESRRGVCSPVAPATVPHAGADLCVGVLWRSGRTTRTRRSRTHY